MVQDLKIRVAAAAVVFALFVAAPGLVIAQTTTFTLPANCSAFVTVQMKNCTVSHHFTCSDDASGYQRRVVLDETSMTYLGVTDAESQWISSFHVLGGFNETLSANPGDPASFSALTSTGIDTYDFRTSSPEMGETHFIGQDRLTGNKVVIDGVELEETEYSIRALDSSGTEMWRSAGNEFISRDWGMFLSGTATIKTPTESWETDDTPVEFIFPGEPGFLSISPKFGCGAMMSSAPMPSETEETTNDQI